MPHLHEATNSFLTSSITLLVSCLSTCLWITMSLFLLKSISLFRKKFAANLRRVRLSFSKALSRYSILFSLLLYIVKSRLTIWFLFDSPTIGCNFPSQNFDWLDLLVEVYIKHNRKCSQCIYYLTISL